MGLYHADDIRRIFCGNFKKILTERINLIKNRQEYENYLPNISLTYKNLSSASYFYFDHTDAPGNYLVLSIFLR